MGKNHVNCNAKKFNNLNLDKFWIVEFANKVFEENCKDYDAVAAFVLSDDIMCKHCTRMKDVLSSDYIVQQTLPVTISIRVLRTQVHLQHSHVHAAPFTGISFASLDRHDREVLYRKIHYHV